MFQCDKRVVIDDCPVSTAVALRMNSFDRAKEQERLIDEMATQIVENAATFNSFSPTGANVWTPPFESRLEPQDPSEPAVSNKALDGEKVTIPSSILEHCKQQISLSALLNQPRHIRRRQCRWLV